MQRIILGGGCFWCLDALYRQVKGVIKVTCGYSGGETVNPTYEQVCTGSTGHAEVVELEFDENVISIETILQIFWSIHDPTTPNQQGYDIGSQYRSVIYYPDNLKQAVEESLVYAREIWDENITTEIDQSKVFYPAEEYHQDYFNRNPNRSYCQLIINPKLKKFRKEFAKLLT